MIQFSRIFKLLSEFIMVRVHAHHSQTHSLASVRKPMEGIMYETGVANLDCGV